MKRDLDLLRAILIEEEDRSKSTLPGKWTEEQICYHQALLIEAGLLRGVVHRFDGQVSLHIDGLTWQGHEFLAATSSEPVWALVRKRLRQFGAEVSIPIIMELAKSLAREALGLPS